MRERPPSDAKSDSSDSKDEEPQDTGIPIPIGSTRAELMGIASHLADTGPTVVDANRWSDDPSLHPDEVILDSGSSIDVLPSAPHDYGDALRDKIVHEVLTPDMLMFWFTNREVGLDFLGDSRQANHRGVPIRNILHGNCRQCLKAGGLMQRCHTCGIDEAFQAQVIFAPYDIPETVLDARFLHRMVGHPDNKHDPHIEGLNPDHGIASARLHVTWLIT